MTCSLTRPLVALLLVLCASTPATSSVDSPAFSLHGGWPIVQAGSAELSIAGSGPALNVNVNDKPLIGGESPDVQVQASGAVVATYSLAGGQLVETVAPMTELGQSAWTESLVYTNRSGQRQDLTGAVMRIAPQLWQGGAVWNPAPLWMGEVGPGRTLHVAYRSVEDSYNLNASGGVVQVNVDSAWRLEPGQSAQIGSLVFWTRPGDAAGFRPEAQRWYSAIGIHVPRPDPNWLANAILYQASAGGHSDSRFSDVGGFDAFSHQLDYLHDLGVNTIWYNLVFSFKTPPDGQNGAWNHYDPRDYAKIDAILGGPEALHRLTARSRQLGIHVIAELVPHGGRSVQAAALTPWWTGGRDGKPENGWGGAFMDYASPPWQDVMRAACQWLAHDFDTEGVRIDTADGDGPNWTSPLTNHASLSTMGGALGTIRAARDGLAAGGVAAPGRVPIIIPESDDHPEHFALTPLGYGSEFTRFFENGLPTDLTDAPAIVTGLRALLETERGALPDGAMRLRTLNNHDTVIEHGRVHQRFGAGLARAFLGVCLATPGVPMLYQEQESGDYDALRRMIWARRALPELGVGEPDYNAANFSPAVFTVVSTLGSSRAMGMVNLSGATVSGKVVFSPSLHIAPGALVYDGVSGRSAQVADSGFAWTLAPYETALIRLGSKPMPQAPAETYAGETYGASDMLNDKCIVWRSGNVTTYLRLSGASWANSVSGAKTTYSSADGQITLLRDGASTKVDMDLAPGAPTPKLVVLGADRWSVSGRTAVLSDRVLHRHFPFPAGSNYTWNRSIVWGKAPWGGLYNGVAPDGRLWESLIEPLHPDDPGMEFVGRDGAGLILNGLSTNAGNIVLTDCTDESPTGSYRLETRFYDVDPDLAPSVRMFGLGTQWEMRQDALPPITARRLHVSFTIDPAKLIKQARWTSPRLPVQRSGMRETDSGPSIAHFFNATWFPQPGNVTWNGFAPAPGVYRIELEMRHSEASATGSDLDTAYVVTVDGAAQPLEWVKRGTAIYGNGYFGMAQTPPIDLSGKSHSISITTSRPWAAVRLHYRLVKAQK